MYKRNLYFVIEVNKLLTKFVMHQSIETPAPRPPGHSGELNIYPELKDGLFPRPRGQETC